MKKLLLLMLLAAPALMAQTNTAAMRNLANTFTASNSFTQPVALAPTVVGLLPSAASVPIHSIVTVTDGASASDCTMGGGTSVVLCQSTGAVWAALSGTPCTSVATSLQYNMSGSLGCIPGTSVNAGSGIVSFTPLSSSSYVYAGEADALFAGVLPPLSGTHLIGASSEPITPNGNAGVTGLFHDNDASAACPSDSCGSALFGVSYMSVPSLSGSNEVQGTYSGALVNNASGKTNATGTFGFALGYPTSTGSAGTLRGGKFQAGLETNSSSADNLYDVELMSVPTTSSGSTVGTEIAGVHALSVDATNKYGKPTYAFKCENQGTTSNKYCLFSLGGQNVLRAAADTQTPLEVDANSSSASVPVVVVKDAPSGNTIMQVAVQGLTVPSYKVSSPCAAAGTAANPSVVSCGASSSGIFFCDVASSAGTCTVNTTAVTTNAVVQITTSAADNSQTGKTCNTAPTAVSKPRLSAKVNGTSFTINVDTLTTNGECFEYLVLGN